MAVLGHRAGGAQVRSQFCLSPPIHFHGDIYELLHPDS